jgi:hypothetical protein
VTALPVIVVSAALVAGAAGAAPAAPDPCAAAAEPAAAGPRDPGAAAVYRAVGDEERAAGDVASATAAYREALRRAPGDARAREALWAMCAGARFDEGLRRMQEGDREGAVAAFEAARVAGADPAAALLEGVCEYELGHDARARPLLAEARTEPAVAGQALFFLGLLALREGDGRGASGLFARAGATDARLEPSADELDRLARRDGRMVLSALAETGWDSNVELSPDGTPRGDGSADGYGALVAGGFARTRGTSSLYARATAQYRQHLHITAYDLADAGAAVGVRLTGGASTVAAEYGYDFVTLGRSPYLSAHRLLASGRLARGGLALGATYYARFESFLESGLDGYSGLRHDAEAVGDWQASAALGLSAGYHVGRDAADTAVFAYLEQGPLLAVRLRAGEAVHLVAESRLTWRTYDVEDPDLEVRRADRYLDGAVAADVDLSARLTLRALGTARRALSNVADFRYSRFTASLALVYAAGVL